MTGTTGERIRPDVTQVFASHLPHRAALWSLAITAACLPLYVLRWRVGPLPTTLLEVLVGVTTLAWLVSVWAEKRMPAWRTPYTIPIALLLVAGVIGIFVAPDAIRAAGIYRAYFFEAVLMFYIAIDVLRSRDDLSLFLVVAAAGSCVMAAGQIALFIAAAIGNTLQLGDAPSFLNTSANAVSMYLEPPLAFALGYAVFSTRSRERWIAAGVLVLVLIGEILTLSRAGYLALTALAVVLVMSGRSARWRLRAVGALAVVGLLILEVPFVNQRLLDLAHSVVNRGTLYRETLQMLTQRPIVGAGISGFTTRIAPYRPPSLVVHIYPHDLWLTMWSELGLLGLIAFAVILLGLLWRGVRALRTVDNDYRPLLWGAVGALILFTVHGLFDSPYWKNDLSVEFWLLAALQVMAVHHANGLPARIGL